MAWLIYFYIWACASVPLALSVIGILYAESMSGKIASLLAAPVVFVVSTILVAGLLGRVGMKGMIEGKFQRSLSDKTYFWRRLHATPWTYIFYFKPLYYVALSVPILKKILFRTFGYKGELDFVVYPDTWLRDIPLLKIGKKAYLSNKSSIATNICLMDNNILVEAISVGENACVGHSTIIGPGTKMGDGAEIDASVTSGIRVTYGKNAKIGEMCGIQHGVKIEEGAIIEATSVIGLRCRIGANVRILEGSHIHTGTRIRNQQEADKYFAAETGALTRARESVMNKVVMRSSAFDPALLVDDEGLTGARKVTGDVS